MKKIFVAVIVFVATTISLRADVAFAQGYGEGVYSEAVYSNNQPVAEKEDPQLPEHRDSPSPGRVSPVNAAQPGDGPQDVVLDSDGDDIVTQSNRGVDTGDVTESGNDSSDEGSNLLVRASAAALIAAFVLVLVAVMRKKSHSE